MTLLVAITGVDREFQAVGVMPVAVFTVAGMVAASAAFVLLQRWSSAPRVTWRRVATVALLASWLPDLLLLVNPATPMGTARPAHVAILALLHLPPFVLAISVLPALLASRARD